ncbi:gliding motility lipoprotein GldH [Emticicia sp. BO119]|uniref:gliding motility lipoprotein GldH n=1 Tax=Emticicia sp. BO119 TaxID=2757768 RepID=UPI0015EFF24B|nr:gliding motility lipoprotein GldH [Emticicia sp. BO119]MBA4850983.1 gliding motility lipoprotein GldH [Emticicia sp. BO119]
MKNLIIGFVLCLSVFGCDSNAIYKSFIDFKDTNWYIKDVPSFTFEVKDETIPYDIYLLVRNASQYPYNNLYVTRYIYGPDNKLINKRLEQVILFEPKTGKPLGKGLGDIWDSKVLSSHGYKFPKKGKYTIKLQQYMRQDPLPFIMSIGLSVEKPLPPKQ